MIESDVKTCQMLAHERVLVFFFTCTRVNGLSVNWLFMKYVLICLLFTIPISNITFFYWLFQITIAEMVQHSSIFI